MNRPSFALIAALALAACDNPVELETDVARFSAVAQGIDITNTSGEAIYYKVIERETAAVVLWAPCVTPATCPSVAARATKRVPYSEIAGYEAGREAIVYHWRLVRSGDGFKADSIRSAVVQLD